MSQALAQTISYVERARAFMPPGTVPPFVMRFDAGSVPVGNLVFSSETRTVGQLQDAALNLVRPLFATLPGVSAPPPFGGSARRRVADAQQRQGEEQRRGGPAQKGTPRLSAHHVILSRPVVLPLSRTPGRAPRAPARAAPAGGGRGGTCA